MAGKNYSAQQQNAEFFFFLFVEGKESLFYKFNTDANGQNLKKNNDNDNGFVIYYVRFILRLGSPSWISSRYEMVF